ncbi:MAG: hypothetical protein LBU76_03430 [Azoarcus sp.]|jgi:hypothetical protein|nr:hypothetical protein [Azoarcus sp.]
MPRPARVARGFDGCIWSNPMVIQTAPKLKVISLGESYSQSLIHIQQGGHAGQVIKNLLGEK